MILRRLPVPLVVAWTVLRELVRALGTPLHIVGFLATAERHRRRCRAAVTAAPARPNDAGAALAFAVRTRAAGRRGHVFLSCGEPSAEIHAVHLVEALRTAVAAAADRTMPRLSAFGGPRLAAAGVAVTYPLADSAIMGIAGVLKALPFICRAHATFLRMLRDDPPDVVVLVDYPGLHLVFAEAARRHGVPVIHYTAPQYWAWGPWRLARYRRAIDATLTILPFEPAYFAADDLVAAYVGHPLVEETARDAAAAPTAADDRPILVLMPGSRGRELELHLPPMLDIARRLCVDQPALRIVIPHRAPKRLARIRALVDAHGATDHVEVAPEGPGAWLPRARAALVKSGTGSLEAALHGVPTVVVFALDSRLVRWINDHLVVAPFFASANLILGRRALPELLILDPATDWPRAEQELRARLEDGPVRDACRADLAELRERLGGPGASARAAQFVLPFCPSGSAFTTRDG